MQGFFVSFGEQDSQALIACSGTEHFHLHENVRAFVIREDDLVGRERSVDDHFDELPVAHLLRLEDDSAPVDCGFANVRVEREGWREFYLSEASARPVQLLSNFAARNGDDLPP